MTLVKLTAPNGLKIFVDRADIGTPIRDNDGTFDERAKATFFLNGRPQAVCETVDELVSLRESKIREASAKTV